MRQRGLLRLVAASASLVPLAAEEPMMGGAPDYHTDVAPILAAHCYECHGADDDQGRLRLHTPAAIRAGGRSGAVITPGDPELSDLYYLCSLDADDPDRMPAEAAPLSATELEVLRRWIAAGASMPGTPDADSAVPRPRVPRIDQDPELAAAVAELPAPDVAAREVLELLGGRCEALTADGKALALDLGGLEGLDTAPVRSALRSLAPHVIALDLGRSDADRGLLAVIPTMPRLRQLDLSQTACDDQALASIGPLPDLRVLNLHATAVSDRSLGLLADCSGLRRLYLFESRVSPTGAARLVRELPACHIDIGQLAIAPPSED